jgi:TRAP-type C4-dicarboxylate transport system substrate-binding protein
MMRRTWMFVALLVVVALAGDALAQQPKYVLRFSSPNSKEHAWGRGAEKFKQLVAEGTRGQVEVQIYHSNSLGATRESLEMVRLGTVDFVLCGVAHLSRFVPEMGTLVLPYLWKDTNTMFGALDGQMGQIIEPLLMEKGFKVVGWWDNGFRNVSNNKRPIKTPEDLKGLKLRTRRPVHIAFPRSSRRCRWTGPRCALRSSRGSWTDRRTRPASCSSRSCPRCRCTTR